MPHQITEPNPNVPTAPKGSASIGHLAELDEQLQVFILYMRRWASHHPERQARVWNDATERFGPAKAHRVIGALDVFLRTIANHAVRPIQHHGLTCDCLGEDEATLAEIIAGVGRQDGPLLRILARPLITPQGFTETISAALQLYEILSEPATSHVMPRPESTVH